MGTEVSEVTHKMKIKKCAINGHTCCATQTCGLCCKEMEFDVLDHEGQPRTDASLKKVHAGGCVECCSAGDMYRFRAPKDKDEAAVFMAAI